MATLKYCVLGAGGAIGSRLVQRLIGEGHEVTAVVRRLSSAVRIGRFALPIKVLDLASADAAEVQGVIGGHDVVIDCTYSVSPDVDANIEESKRMAGSVLAACRAANVRALVHLGTISVYPDGLSTVDESVTCKPKGQAYADGKLAAEQILLSGEAGSTSVIVLQLPIVIGPFMGWTKSIAQQLSAAPLIIPAEISGHCDPLHVDDVVRGVQLASQHLLKTNQCLREKVLLQGEKSVSWNEFYCAHAELLSSKAADQNPLLEQLPRAQYDAKLKLLAEQQRPWRQLKKYFIEVGRFRQLVLAQWGVHSIYRGYKRVRGQAGMDQIKHRIAAGIPESAAVTRESQQPTLLSAPLLATLESLPSIDSEKAFALLGFRAELSFTQSLQSSLAWLKWANLLPVD